jgi:betaine-aldehyde dehydrogenase
MFIDGAWTAGSDGTADLADREAKVAPALAAGNTCVIKPGEVIAGSEWGGIRRSGNGRVLGPTGLAEYQQHKHVWHSTAPALMRWFKGGEA